MPLSYERSYEWVDIVPIPQDEGGPNPLATIAYSDEYSEAMSYLRAVMAQNEMSDRVLALTEHIIGMNPAHYTVWLYRAKILSTLQKDPLKELEWLEGIALRHLKNYQIWHHREVIMALVPTLPPTEFAFLANILSHDTKNYHVWSYRQWLVRHFSLWAGINTISPELTFVDALLHSDVRNNSAWNHRWFVLFGYKDAGPANPAPQVGNEKELCEREIEYSKEKILEAPQNGSAWNYLRGVVKRGGEGVGVGLEAWAESFADVERVEEVRSSHALDFLADMWEKEGEKEKAGKALTLLAERFDPVRKNYWEYRRRLLKMGVEA